MAKTKQKEKTLLGEKQVLIVAGLMVLLFVFAFGVFAADRMWSSAKQQANASSDAVTIEGMAVCLPHKDTTGPQTQECAIGLKANSGRYYAVRGQDITSSLGTNKTVKVTAVIEEPGDSKYDISGTLSVKN